MSAFLKEAARWMRYLYFLRFGIFIWVFPLLLIWANGPGGLRSFVSGIITPSDLAQYICASFFLVSASFVALILSRVVVINGEERFGDPPPRLIVLLLADEMGRYEWVAPLICQINTAIIFVYFFINGRTEHVHAAVIAWGIGWGVVLAVLFWIAISVLYYLTFRPRKGGSAARTFGNRAARTILAPRSLLLLSRVGHNDGDRGDVLEDANTPIDFRFDWSFLPVPGYRSGPHGDIYEGHSFSLIAATGFIALYWVMWPLTAPVIVYYGSIVALCLYLLGATALYFIVLSANAGKPDQRQALRWWKIGLAFPIFGFAVALPYLYWSYDAARFPTLALVLLLVISFTWTLGAIAFFADRYRIPVLTTLVILVALPRFAHLLSGQEEHYLSTSTAPTQFALHSPQEILKAKLDLDSNSPLIIVTSTGGGVHAAAFTATILQELEENVPDFRQHILLMSTVSGGSGGLYTYLRELSPKANSNRTDWRRMINAAQCSSLEAAGWGLVYTDIPKAVFPFFPFPSNGANDLATSPIGKDRTWALRRAFVRNLDDRFCTSDDQTEKRIPVGERMQALKREKELATGLTLTAFDPMQPSVPAFAMNTTTVERGQRFLLANYSIHTEDFDLQNGYNAPSFLATYPSSKAGPTDLPLATAAQMSGTFPIVSSAARVPLDLAHSANKVFHFVDGGYYDNDGTGTAIEFLNYALLCGPQVSQNSKAPSCPPSTPRPPVRILLIEIRNSGDNTPTNSDGAYDNAWKPAPWNLVDQAQSPVNALLAAGHDSVTGRNRAALAMLQQALGDHALIERVVVADSFYQEQGKSQSDPLSWSLTPAQKEEIATSAQAPRLMKQVYDANALFKSSVCDWKRDLHLSDPACSVQPSSSNPGGAPKP